MTNENKKFRHTKAIRIKGIIKIDSIHLSTSLDETEMLIQTEESFIRKFTNTESKIS